jgi:hypothetical protein
MLAVSLYFSILQNYFFYWKDDDDGSCLGCVRQSLETQMATFSYSFLTLLYNAEISPSKITPSIYPSISSSLPILFRIYSLRRHIRAAATAAAHG